MIEICQLEIGHGVKDEVEKGKTMIKGNEEQGRTSTNPWTQSKRDGREQAHSAHPKQ